MSRRAYVLLTASLTLAFLASAKALSAVSLPASVVVLWFAVNAASVALAYAVNAPGIFGKNRATGIVPVWSRLVWWPYLAIVRAWCAALRFGKHQAAANEVAPNIFVGRPPTRGLPQGVTLVIDLCAELGKATVDAAYLSIPTLDGCAAHRDDARSAVLVARGHQRVLVHCAAGQGRSATVAALIALDRGLFTSGDDVVRAFRQVRPPRHLAASAVTLGHLANPGATAVDRRCRSLTVVSVEIAPGHGVGLTNYDATLPSIRSDEMARGFAILAEMTNGADWRARCEDFLKAVRFV